MFSFPVFGSKLRLAILTYGQCTVLGSAGASGGFGGDLITSGDMCGALAYKGRKFAGRFCRAKFLCFPASSARLLAWPCVAVFLMGKAGRYCWKRTVL